MKSTITISIPTATDYWGADVQPEEVPVLVSRFRALLDETLAEQFPGHRLEFRVVEHNTGSGVSTDPEDDLLVRDIEQLMSDRFVDAFPVQ